MFPDQSTKACVAYNASSADPKVIKLAKSCGAFQISLDLVAIMSVLIAGLLTSKLIANRANHTQETTGTRPRVWHLRLAVVAVPTLLTMWVLGFYLGYPELKGFNFKGGIHLRSSLLALWAGAVTVHSGLYCGNRACRYSGHFQRSIRGCSRAWASSETDHEPCDFTASNAGYLSAIDFAIPEPD